MTDVALAWRRAHRSSPGSRVSVDSASLLRLAGAPFVPGDLSSPWAWGPVAIAGLAAFATPGGTRGPGDVESMTVLGHRLGPTRGTLLALTYDAAYLVSTAIGEELFFRGLVQSELASRWNRDAAIAASTVSFAAFHLPRGGLKGAAIAGVAGAYLGARFQRGGANLKEVVAMHFWLDFLPVAIESLRDPRRARTVSEIRWKNR